MHFEYMARLAVLGYTSEVFNTPGFRYHVFALVMMHIGCRGILQYLLGSTVLETFNRIDDVYQNHRSIIKMTCTQASANNAQPVYNLAVFHG